MCGPGADICEIGQGVRFVGFKMLILFYILLVAVCGPGADICEIGQAVRFVGFEMLIVFYPTCRCVSARS